ncbi:extracellular calcium-sensing receptor-like [Protopterus annectens]|uniref:extracellular calcium-sensing receptor-like n=1 Tax=Protopterus annectens TaxID=7888 RepID=UPI001CFB3052|nr:extracellular calcium-sensing receptor-like [Protopterus annectens]
MIFAIEEINQNPSLLPNITLGFQIYDSCYTEVRALQGALWILTGNKETIPNYSCHPSVTHSAIVGEMASRLSMTVSRVLSLYRYPQISYGAVISTLSDKQQFPSFLRTVPRDSSEPYALAQLLWHFKWNWIGIISSNDDRGILSSQELRNEFFKLGGCIAFLETVSLHNSRKSILRVVDVVKASSASVIVVYCSAENLTPFMEMVAMQKVTGKVWISSSSWSVSSDFSSTDILKALNGSIGIAYEREEIPGLMEHLQGLHPATSTDDVFIQTFWEKSFGCYWPASETKLQGSSNKTFCTGYETMENVDVSLYDAHNFSFVYTAYNAVYAVTHALHNLLSCQPGKGPFVNQSCAHILHFWPWQLFHYIKNVQFSNKVGDDVFFDENGDPPIIYNFLNWQMFSDGSSTYKKVGVFDSRAPPGYELSINESAILWFGGYNWVPRSVCSESCVPGYRQSAFEDRPLCCFQCIPCPLGEITNQTDSIDCRKCPQHQWSNELQDRCIPKHVDFLAFEDLLGMSLAFIAVICSLFTLVILSLFIKYRETPVVKANNLSLSYLLLLALILCFLCSLMFIGRPMNVNCMIRQVAFGVVFSFCVTCILAKTVVVIIVFNATQPDSILKKWVGTNVPSYIIFICTAVQVLICTCWLTVSPPFPVLNMSSEPGWIIMECNEGSAIAFWCMLGYICILSGISFLAAFMARKLPDTFNEAKYITFSLLVFASVWLSFIPAYLSTHGKYMVSVEIFAILSSSAGMLGCIFLPKCYIILLRPDLNTKEHLIKKGKLH